MSIDLMLYKQISRKLENDILAGKLPPGCCIPSVRELAAQYPVNPNTVQRVIREMEMLGYSNEQVTTMVTTKICDDGQT